MEPFVERQSFRKTWQRVLAALPVALTTALFGYGMTKQMVLDEPWGTTPMSDRQLALTALWTVGLNAGITWLLYRMELTVETRDDGLYIRFFPFVRRTIAYGDIRRAEAVRYKPLPEYGGWGLRYGASGKAYNVSGDRGVQLEMASGERLLLGSQREVELADAINARRGV